VNNIKWVWYAFLFGALWGSNLSPTFLVLNQFDRDINNIDSTLARQFQEPSFNFVQPDSQFTIDIDGFDNPAASQMDYVKELGKTYGVNFILYNHISLSEKRMELEGRLFNTRSGGLVNRRIIDLTNYLGGQMNELNLWVGELLGLTESEWEERRKSIIFLPPEQINREKSPAGAALRSLAAPGWGQAYGGNKVGAYAWVGTETSLSLAILMSYLNYDKASKSYLSNLTKYEASNDVSDVDAYRAQAESDWDDHVKFNQLIIGFAGATGAGWLANSLHAWIVFPRPHKNIYQKWDQPVSGEDG